MADSWAPSACGAATVSSPSSSARSSAASTPSRSARSSRRLPSLAFSLTALSSLSPLVLLLTHPAAVSAQTFYFAGQPLVLNNCVGPDNGLITFTQNPDGTIVNQGSNLCVEAWPGSDYGFGAQLRLQQCQPNNPLQQWVVAPSGAGSTIRTNSTVIIGCLGFNVWQGNWAVGDEVGPYLCGDPSPNPDEIFQLNQRFPGAIEAVDGSGNPSGLCVSVNQPTTSYTLDDTIAGAIGAAFDGVGLIAGEGVARLLFDYPEPQRSQILDLLFSTTNGLGIHILKIEIGSDGMSTMGSEPAHQRTQGEPSFASTRGTQVWLAQQARQRNTNIKLFALPWGWPGWLRSTPSDTTPFANPFAAAGYVRDWLSNVLTVGGLTVDYVGVFSDVWDKDLSPGYVKTLRKYLDSAGFANCLIVCADVNDWSCATAALADQDLMNAVGVFGNHDPPRNQDPNITGKPLWRPYVSTGAANLEHAPGIAGAIHNSYINWNLTAVIPKALIGSSYNTLPEWNYGVVLADQPWSGWYRVTPLWYVIGHTTQFTKPGWRHLSVGLGSGKLTNGGTYVTRVDTSTGQWLWSTVIEKTGGSDTEEYATFTLGGNIFATSQTVYALTSCFGATGTNVSFYQQPVTGGTILPEGGVFSIWLAPNCITTITNQAGAGFPPTVPAASIPPSFPATGGDDFTSATPGNPGQFWSDMNGAFEVVDDPSAGRGLQQKSVGQPITRRNTDSRPHTILGDPDWIDVDFTIKTFLPSSTDVAVIGVRANAFNDTAGVDGSSGVDDMPGFWLFLSTSGWSIQYDLKQSTTPVRSGPLAVPVNPGEWHSIRLLARGDSVFGILDGFILFRQNVTYTGTLAFTPTKGFLALGAGAFGQFPIFGAYTYQATYSPCSYTPTVGTQPHEEPCEPGSWGQGLSFLPTGNGIGGQFQLNADTTLCMQMNATSDPQYRYQQTRALTLQPCNVTEPRQIFKIEATTVDADGAAPIGPITGIDGLVVNIFGNSETDDSDVSGYVWQGGTNEWWWWDASTGSLFAPFMGTCLSFCGTM